MRYRIKNRNTEHEFDTLDALIVSAGKPMQWAHGKHISAVLAWADSCLYKAYVAQHAGAREYRLERVLP